MIAQIAFEDIYPIWSKHLWADRITPITPSSAMNYLNGYDLKNMSYDPIFFAYYYNNEIVGVNSCHRCIDGGYRSRGLYVFPNFRKQGIGISLLQAAISQGKKDNSDYIWSYPKLQSWTTYYKAGFTLSSDWEKSELGLNAYCIKKLKE